MSRIPRFLSTTVGIKLLMGLTGLALLVFLIGHASGNLLVFAGTPDAESTGPFNAYGHALISNPAIYLIEIVLLALFLVHAVMAVRFTLRNRQARPDRYAVKRAAGGASRKSIASSTMIFSGLAILVFVPWHLIGMKWGTHYEALADPEVRDLHRLMTEYFRDPLHAFAYMGFMLLLGFHLWHGFASGFESLGCRHRSWVMKLGHVLAVLVAGAFFIIPLIIFIKGVGK